MNYFNPECFPYKNKLFSITYYKHLLKIFKTSILWFKLIKKLLNFIFIANL